MYFTASCTVSAIFSFYIITGSLRLQKVLTLAPFSTDASPYLEFIMPKGLMADAPTKSTRNLLDDASFINAQQLLKAAGATE